MRNAKDNRSAPAPRRGARGIEQLESRVLMARPLGIDVSDYQPSINWTSVKSAGYDFAWTKATEGVTFNATTFTSTRMNSAKNAGVVIGAYHYARYDNNTATAEVNHFLSIAGAYIGPGWLPPMLDVGNPVTAGDLNSTKP